MKLTTATALSLFLLCAPASFAQDEPGPPPTHPTPPMPPQPPMPPAPPTPPVPPMPPGPPGTPGPEMDAERRKELRRRISALRMARLTQVLDLDEATAAKLFPAINHQDERSAQIAEEHGKQMRKLDELCHKSGVKDDEVSPVIDALFATRKQMRDLEDELHAKVRSILTPSQMAKFILFHEHFGDEVREMLHGEDGHGGGDAHRQHEEMARAHAAFAHAAKQRANALHEQAKAMRQHADAALKNGMANEADVAKMRAQADQMDAEASRIEAEVQRQHAEGPQPQPQPVPQPAPAPQPPRMR